MLKVMYIATVNIFILETLTDKSNITIAFMWPFYWHIYV